MNTRARLSGALALTTALLIGTLSAPAYAATVGSSPARTWQTVGSLNAKGRNVAGQVMTVAYGRRASRRLVFLGGNFTRMRPPRGSTASSVRRLHLAALTVRRGRLVKTWHVAVRFHGSAKNATVQTVALSGDGTILYVGGRFDSIGGKRRSNVAALSATSGRVLGWHPSPNGRVHALTVSGRSRVYLGGTFTAVNGHRRLHVAAVTRRGHLVTKWHPSIQQVGGACPPRCAPDVHAIALSHDRSTVYLGGTFGLVNGVPRNSTAAVRAGTGHLTKWNPSIFSSGARGSLNTVHHMVRVGGTMYLCGDFWQLNYPRATFVSPNLAAVTTGSGDAISSFNAATDGSVNSCAVHKRLGALFLGGHFDHVGTRNAVRSKTAPIRHHMAAVKLGSGGLLAWAPDANSVPGAYAVAAQKRHIAYGGEFTTVNGRAQAGFAQFRVRL